MKTRPLLLIALIVLINLPAVRAQADVHFYRYELLTRAQELQYLTEVPAGATGRHYVVETDALGRVTRTAAIRDGRTISERVFTFAPDAKASSGYDALTGAEKTGRVRIQRNAEGGRTREDSFTLDGTLTGYTLYVYRDDAVEVTQYTSDGKKKAVYVSSFSPEGIRSREIAYSNPDDRSVYVDSDYDVRTGLRKGTTQFEGGSLSNSGLFDYDDNGDLIRQDVFDPTGRWFAAAELVDGLTTKRLYDSSKELRYSYDERRRVKETTLFYNEMLVCRFTYDRLADGTATRTLAYGPDGALWAEYPDMEVVDVRQNGLPINGRPAVINRHGNWY